MSFDLATLNDLVARHGRIVRVVVAEARGSAPREAGAWVAVWDGGQHGTIGGGALEWEAVARARDVLQTGAGRVDTLALGPALGQCCGGRVTLVTEVWDQASLGAVSGAVIARPAPGGPAEMPLGIRRRLAALRAQGARPGTALEDGWLIEPVAEPDRLVWIYGAGHVGRAIAGVLAPLPGVAVTLIDDAPDRFPDDPAPGVTSLVAKNPADAVGIAPDTADHLVLTYSHALDLEICHRILGRAFRSAGLIGSKTKRARFRTRLAALGHAPAMIDRIRCPIGDPSLGKHPQAIALGVAAELIRAPLADAERAAR